MNAPRIRFAIPLSFGLLVLTSLCATAADAGLYTKTYSVGNHPEVHVQAGDSHVRVITSETNQVEFRVRSEGSRVAIGIGGDVDVDSQQNGNRVDLTVKTTPAVMLGFNNKRIETDVQMPANADLLIDTSDGSVELSSLSGNITVHTKDGSIRARQLAGQIDLRSSDGGISANGLKGEAKLRSTDGAIGADEVDGKLDAWSTDGSIRVDGRFDALNIKSGDGAITARAARGSKMTGGWNVQSGDGSLHLSIPSDLQANLDVSAGSGRVSVDLPVTVQGISNGRSNIRGTLNGGGPALTVRSGDGSVHVDGI